MQSATHRALFILCGHGRSNANPSPTKEKLEACREYREASIGKSSQAATTVTFVEFSNLAGPSYDARMVELADVRPRLARSLSAVELPVGGARQQSEASIFASPIAWQPERRSAPRRSSDSYPSPLRVDELLAEEGLSVLRFS